MLYMVSLCANNQLLARVIFTPQMTLELRNHGVDTSMHAQIATRLLSLSVKMHCIWLQLFKIFSKSKIREF